MKSISLVFCFLTLFAYGCGNSEKTTQTENEKSYSEELGQKIGGSINDMKQKANDAVDATNEQVQKTMDTGAE